MAEAALKEKPAAEEERELTDGFNLIIDALKLNGLDTIYGVPGIPITDFGRMAQAAGIRVISFRHEQNAGNAAAIAGFLTRKPGVCLTVSAPGFLNGLTALAHATTNCFPMILISGSSEREIVDLQQGDYEEMDQLAIAKPLCKAAFRVLHAADIGIGVARAIRAAVSGRPGGVYLDLPAKLFGQVMDAEAGRKSLVQVIDAAPAQIPAARCGQARTRCAEEREASADHPRQGRAYAQADDAIRSFVEKSGVPFLPMSMGKGLLPDTHPQCAGAARSTVLKDSDVVMLIGARLNWLLSHGKGKTWGDAPKKVHPDRHRAEGDGLERRDRGAGGGRHRLLRLRAARRHGCQLAGPAGGLDRRGRQEARGERLQDGAAADEQQLADGLPRRARRAAHHRQGAARRHPGQRRRQHARSRARHHRHVSAAQAARRRHLGRDGHRHGLRDRGRRSRPASRCSRSRATSAFGFSGMEVETICRYKLPVCVVIFNNDGIYRGTDVNAVGSDPAPTVFVKGSRYDKMMEASAASASMRPAPTSSSVR
jgi:oxalyl-CoA decarboxylase